MPRWYAPWRRGRRAAIISFYFSVHTRLSQPEIAAVCACARTLQRRRSGERNRRGSADPTRERYS